jgi:hypothetical protein
MTMSVQKEPMFCENEDMVEIEACAPNKNVSRMNGPRYWYMAGLPIGLDTRWIHHLNGQVIEKHQPMK